MPLLPARGPREDVVRRRHRERRGRGLRGSLAPAEVPLARTTAERFDDVASAAVARLDKRWAAELAAVQFLVEDVPDVAGIAGIAGKDLADRALTGADPRWVPLGRSEPAEAGLPARVVLYRRPIQTRAPGELALRRLVLDVLVEQVAELLGLDPQEVDPGYSGDD